MTPTSPPSYEFLDTIDDNNPISQIFCQTLIIPVATPYADGVPGNSELHMSDTTNMSFSPLALSSHPSAESDLSTTDPVVMGFPSRHILSWVTTWLLVFAMALLNLFINLIFRLTLLLWFPTNTYKHFKIPSCSML